MRILGALSWFLAAGIATAQMPTARVVVERAAIRELPSTIILVGTVEPLTRSVIGSEMAGIVEKMPVRQGDLVQAGSMIVKLNDDTIRYQLAEAQAASKALEADMRRWEFELQRVRHLYGKEHANEKEVYDTVADYDRARYRVEEQKAIVSRYKTDLAKTEITAPFSGYVVDRRTEVGEWIARGGPVVEMIDLSSVLVRVDVPEFAIPFVRLRDGAAVKIDALGRVFEGEIRHIIRQADPDARTFPVEIEIDNAEGLLAGGMFARATIVSGPQSQTVAVPKDAIVVRDGITYVGLIIPGHEGSQMGVLTAVMAGSDVGDWIAITSDNLAPGMQVITRGNERLFPFPSPVVIVDETGTPVADESGRGRPGTQAEETPQPPDSPLTKGGQRGVGS